MDVTVVCGPPGSGKSTYVARKAEWGDLIVDLEAILTAISGYPRHRHPRGLVPFARAAKDELVEAIEIGLPGQRAWVIVGGASRAERQSLRQRLGATVIVFEVPAAECLRRIAADGSRTSRDGYWEPIVARWWQEYERDPADTWLS